MRTREKMTHKINISFIFPFEPNILNLLYMLRQKIAKVSIFVKEYIYI